MTKLQYYIKDTRAQLAIMTILFIVAYYVPFRSMVNVWWENVDYSYGFLIPVASAYLIWEKRKTFGSISVRTAWWILPILIIFILISLYGILGSSGNVSMPAVPILIILFVGFCFGIEFIKWLALPLGFLFFMVPVPSFIDRYIGLYLKAISSQMGGAMIGFFNIPVNVNGNIIDLGVTQLQVVDACSGLRYLFPLFALGVLYAYFFEQVAWKRILCVFLTIPLGVLLNVMRIGGTGILTDRFGPVVSDGFFHGFSGWIVFVIAFLMLFLIGRVLSFISPKAVQGDGEAVPGSVNTAVPNVQSRKTTVAFILSVVMLVSVAALSLSTGTMPAVAIKGGIESFPLKIGEWKGVTELVDPVIVKASGAEEAFGGYFANGSEAGVSLYMGYRSSAFLATDNFFHTPTVCIPSSGWVEQEVGRRTIKNVVFFGDLEVTTMVIEKAGRKQIVYFWFQTKDEATYDKNINRFHLSLHAIRRDNTHDLFIRPITVVESLESVEDAKKRLDHFVREMMPVLIKFLKEKQVVKTGVEL